MEALRERLDTALGPALEEGWEEVLAEWPDGDRGDRERILEEVQALRDRLLGVLLGFSSEAELQRGIAVAYAEAKARWTLLTTQIQDTTKRDGRVDDRLVVRATCISLIVQQLDPLVRPAERKQLTEFLAEPLE